MSFSTIHLFFFLLVPVIQKFRNLCYSGFKHESPFWQCKFIKWFWKTTCHVQRAIQIVIRFDAFIPVIKICQRRS